MAVTSFKTVPKQQVVGPHQVVLSAVQGPLAGTAGVVPTVPGANPLPALGISFQTGTYALISNDQASVVHMTGASAAPTLDVTTATKGWWAILRNDTLAPMPVTALGYTIDNDPLVILAVEEAAFLWFNGTEYETLHFEPNLRPPRGHIFGLTLSNNGTTGIDIAAGEAASADTVPALLGLTSVLSNKLVGTAWSVGASSGGLDTGAVTNGTYHTYVIRRPDTGVVDACFSTSATGPTFGANIPSAYTQHRRIGSIVRAAGAIRGFIQNGDNFRWMVPITDVNITNPPTSAVLRTLSVPTGIIVEACGTVGTYNGGTNDALLLTNPALTDTTPVNAALYTTYSRSTSGSIQASTEFRCFTNTSAQIRSRDTTSGASDEVIIITTGWIDARGRFGAP